MIINHIHTYSGRKKNDALNVYQRERHQSNRFAPQTTHEQKKTVVVTASVVATASHISHTQSIAERDH